MDVIRVDIARSAIIIGAVQAEARRRRRRENARLVGIVGIALGEIRERMGGNGRERWRGMSKQTGVTPTKSVVSDLALGVVKNFTEWLLASLEY